MGYEKIINCEICGEVVITKSSRGKYCRDCAKDQHRLWMRNYKRTQLIKKAANERKERKDYTIAEINEMARREGLTYGKYVAKMYCEKRKAAAKNATAS